MLLITPIQDGGPVELTTEDMSDDELMSYIKTEEEIKATASYDEQGNLYSINYIITIFPFQYRPILIKDCGNYGNNL